MYEHHHGILQVPDAKVLAVIALVALIGVIWHLLRHGQTRVAVAFAVAPLAVPVTLFLIFRDPTSIVAAIFAYPLALVPGIPLYFILRRIGWLGLWHFVLSSAVLAACIGIALSPSGSLHRDALPLAAGFFANGAVVGLAFWLVAFARVTAPSASK
jgi:hypothetical protein